MRYGKLFIAYCLSLFMVSAHVDIQAVTSFPLDARYTIESSWPTGYQVIVTLTNNNENPTDSWSATFVLGQGQTISGIWNGILKANDQNITVSNLTSVGSGIIPAHGSITFGFVVQNPQYPAPVINNLQASANGGSSTLPIPNTPVLNAIAVDQTGAYTVSWNNVGNATSYTLQSSSTNDFANPVVVAEGSMLSKAFSNQPVGTYFYRVSASNATGASSFSNVQSAVVTKTPTPPTPTIPKSPVLNAITVDQAGAYTVSWDAIDNATFYTLESATKADFSNALIEAQGPALSKTFSGQPSGTYYYRVSASNNLGRGAYSNAQSAVVGTPTPPNTTVPNAPALNAIAVSQTGSYTVSWNSVPNATSYTLQSSPTNDFANPVVAAQGAALSKSFSNQPVGTYFYRVSASNAAGTSSFSNVQSANVTTEPTPPTPSAFVIESYWESWDSATSLSAIVNMHVDIINVSFGNFANAAPHEFTVAGVEALPGKLAELVTLAHNAGKKVKVAIGGATYPLAYQLLTSADAMGMAKALAAYMQENNLDGVDFDIEDYPTPALQIELMKNTRQLLGNNALISYTPKSPASTTYPYNEVIRGAHTYLDAIMIMAYDYAPGYQYQQDVQALIAMGVPAGKIVVGLMPGPDDANVMTSVANITAAAQYIKQNGLRGIMFWDLNRDLLNTTGIGASAATNAAWNAFHA